MDLNITIVDMNRTQDDKVLIVYRIGSDPTTSIVLTDADVASLTSLRSAFQTKLKAKLYVGQQFTVTV